MDRTFLSNFSDRVNFSWKKLNASLALSNNVIVVFRFTRNCCWPWTDEVSRSSYVVNWCLIKPWQLVCATICCQVCSVQKRLSEQHIPNTGVGSGHIKCDHFVHYYFYVLSICISIIISISELHLCFYKVFHILHISWFL